MISWLVEEKQGKGQKGRVYSGDSWCPASSARSATLPGRSLFWFAATIVAEFVHKTLTDPKFIERLKTTEERVERISAQLDAAVEKLENVNKVYEEKLRILSELMKEYRQLGGECSEQVKLIQSRAEELIKQYQSNIKHVCTTIFVN